MKSLEIAKDLSPRAQENDAERENTKRAQYAPVLFVHAIVGCVAKVLRGDDQAAHAAVLGARGGAVVVGLEGVGGLLGSSGKESMGGYIIFSL